VAGAGSVREPVGKGRPVGKGEPFVLARKRPVPLSNAPLGRAFSKRRAALECAARMRLSNPPSRGPHPEGVAQRRVSKDGPRVRAVHPSFETPCFARLLRMRSRSAPTRPVRQLLGIMIWDGAHDLIQKVYQLLGIMILDGAHDLIQKVYQLFGIMRGASFVCMKRRTKPLASHTTAVRTRAAIRPRIRLAKNAASSLGNGNFAS
jgi:hypothetical protein